VDAIYHSGQPGLTITAVPHDFTRIEVGSDGCAETAMQHNAQPSRDLIERTNGIRKQWWNIFQLPRDTARP